jgi:uncharacterized OB-fold protein
MAEAESFSAEGRLLVPYNNWVGAFSSRFFHALKENKELNGVRCPSCDKVYFPPRSVCPGCFAELEQWVRLPPTGRLLTYTVVSYNYGDYYQPARAPYALGIIQLDGADTGLCHFLGEAAHDKIRIGMQVEAVFAEERSGTILDIAYFKPAGSP